MIWIRYIILALCCAVSHVAEGSSQETPSREPSVADHLFNMERLQQNLNRMPAEEQAKQMPQYQEAERQACQWLWKDQQQGVGAEQYRAEGGYELSAFVTTFGQYCERYRR